MRTASACWCGVLESATPAHRIRWASRRSTADLTRRFPYQCSQIFIPATRPRFSVARNWPVVAFATSLVAVTGLVPGCIDPRPGGSPAGTAPGADEALRNWDFRHQAGLVQEELPDLGWVHVIVAAPENLTEADFHFRATWAFGGEVNRPKAAMWYIGAGLRGPYGQSPFQAGYCVGGTSSSRRVSVEASAMGATQGFEQSSLVGLPTGGRTCGDEEYTVEITGKTIQLMRENMDEERPTLEIFVSIMGARPSAPAGVLLRWSHTVAHLSYGPQADGFMANYSDFQSQVRLQASAGPVQAIGGHEMRLTKTLGVPGAAVAVAFTGVTGVGGRQIPNQPPSTYTRPDGTTQQTGGDALEWSDLVGPWTFAVPRRTMATDADMPVVWGTAFRRAALP